VRSTGPAQSWTYDSFGLAGQRAGPCGESQLNHNGFRPA